MARNAQLSSSPNRHVIIPAYNYFVLCTKRFRHSLAYEDPMSQGCWWSTMHLSRHPPNVISLNSVQRVLGPKRLSPKLAWHGRTRWCCHCVWIAHRVKFNNCSPPTRRHIIACINITWPWKLISSHAAEDCVLTVDRYMCPRGHCGHALRDGELWNADSYTVNYVNNSLH